MSEQAASLTPRRAYNIRQIKDRLMTWCMGFGGISVIIAIVLIFFYLLYVVFPLFIPAHMQKAGEYSLPAADQGSTIHLSIEEQNEIGARFTDQGSVTFFDVRNGEVLDNRQIVPEGQKVISFAHGRLSRGYIAYGLDSGGVLVARHIYKIEYGESQRTIVPEIFYPFGEEPLEIDDEQLPVMQLAIRLDEEKATIAVATEQDSVILTRLVFQEELADEPVEVEKTSIVIPNIQDVEKLLINADQRLLYIVHGSDEITMVDIEDIEEPQIVERKRVVDPDAQLTSIDFLTGEISLLIGDDKGNISQWFPTNSAQGKELTRIRGFDTEQTAIQQIVTEQRRKGFIAVDNSGQMGVYHSTAQRTLLSQKITQNPILHLAVSPRANVVLTEDSEGNYQDWHVENEHPEISWKVLWQKVWYESYNKPEYIWQSSSSSNDFEPKLSLMPLAFGTFKAAMYAMLFAVPLSIMGAIFAAYFMSPSMRSIVKPTIEIMGALPTVILGFLAGLWLAPTIEAYLPGVFALLLLLPVGVLLFAFAWHALPAKYRESIPDGWQAALLIPVIILISWVAFASSHNLESLMFAGDMRAWLSHSLGLDFDQRNSLVVGIAMGVAVIPTIFSITEDAIFSVPKHLTFGSLALGATPWQTLVRVVILTASPGIFSAVMIGLGRAVGETMIVLMATGNTPIMDMNIFEGMRTLSANVAVEMPESEVNSTHYRVLFLAAFVLFIFTFVFNTLAEIIRQRLRKKYSSL